MLASIISETYNQYHKLKAGTSALKERKAVTKEKEVIN